MHRFMKRRAISTPILLVIFGTVIIVGGLAAWFFLRSWPSQEVPGSGNLVTEEKAFSDFTVIGIENGFEVTITQSESYSVKIIADDNVIDYVQLSKTGDTLYIGLKPGLYGHVTLKSHILMPELHELHLFSGSHGVVSGFYNSSEFNLCLDSGSSVEMVGSTDYLKVSADGGSIIELSDFPAHHGYVTLGGGSYGTINLDGRLDADLTEGSHLYYTEEPSMGDINTSDGSTVGKKGSLKIPLFLLLRT